MWQLHASKRLIMRDKSLEEDMGSFICREILEEAKKDLENENYSEALEKILILSYTQ